MAAFQSFQASPTWQKYSTIELSQQNHSVVRNPPTRSPVGRDEANKADKSSIFESVIQVPGQEEYHGAASWMQELCSLAFGTLILGVIIGMLLYMNNKDYFETWKMPLSLSAILSILSAALCASTLHAVSSAIGQWKWIEYNTKDRPLRLWDVYDECSRGPLGALEVLYHIPLSILLIGALATLGSLAVPPFIQQTAELVPRLVRTRDDGVVMKFATEYNTNPGYTGFETRASGVEARDPGFRGAVLQGIYGMPVDEAFRCGGSCEWNQTYQSIAFTSRCTDVTSATIRTNYTEVQISQYEAPFMRNMTTPGGVNLQSRYVQTDSGTVLALNATMSPSLQATISSTPMPPEILRLAVFRAGNMSWYNWPWAMKEDVTECSISLVSREFSNINTNGTNFMPGAITDTPLGNGSFHFHVRDPSGVVNETQDVLTFGTAADGTALPKNITIGVYDLYNLLAFFQSTSFSSSIVAGNGRNSDNGGAVFAFLKTIRSDTASPGDATSAVKAVGDVVDSMTHAISEYVRTGTINSVDATGLRVDQIVYAVPRWLFLIYPVVWQLMAISFVVLVMWTNSKDGRIPLWKNSAVAMILHSYDGQKVVRVEDPKRVDGRNEKIETWGNTANYFPKS